jgi:hypothetical protein
MSEQVLVKTSIESISSKVLKPSERVLVNILKASLVRHIEAGMLVEQGIILQIDSKENHPSKVQLHWFEKDYQFSLIYGLCKTNLNLADFVVSFASLLENRA